MKTFVVYAILECTILLRSKSNRRMTLATTLIHRLCNAHHVRRRNATATLIDAQYTRGLLYARKEPAREHVAAIPNSGPWKSNVVRSFVRLPYVRFNQYEQTLKIFLCRLLL